MFPAPVVRKLARSEEMFARSQTFFGATVQMTGPVDAGAMSEAFDTLLAAHPVLGAHLERGPDGVHAIVVDDLLPTGVCLVERGETRRGAGLHLDQAVSLANLRLKIGDGRAAVTLYTHHSLADAHHQSVLLAELFSWYTDAVCTGRIGPVVARPAPQPLEAVLAERGIGRQSRSGLERFMPVMFAHDLPPSARNSAGGNPRLPALVPSARCRLTEQQTQALTAFCRDCKLSLNAVISAAILLAEWQLRNTPDIPIPYLYPVDLRLLVSPPVDGTDSTNPLGVATYLAQITPDTQIADLAADIVETFRADLSEGIIQQSLLHFNLQYAGNPPGLPDLVIVSEGGVLPALRTPPELNIDAVVSELHTASAAGVDLYGSSAFANRVQIEHHSHSPGPEKTIEAIRELLCSLLADDDWMAE